MSLKKIIINTLGTANKPKVGKRRIIPYCKSFPYCEYRVFVHAQPVSTEKCTIKVF